MLVPMVSAEKELSAEATPDDTPAADTPADLLRRHHSRAARSHMPVKTGEIDERKPRDPAQSASTIPRPLANGRPLPRQPQQQVPRTEYVPKRLGDYDYVSYWLLGFTGLGFSGVAHGHVTPVVQ
jgi:hypothetical protein